MIKAFGKVPSGREAKLIRSSTNYRNGSFQNLSSTEITLKEASAFKMFRNFISKPETTRPHHILPSIKTDLKLILSDKPVIIWFGHSSYFISYRNTRILIDPVLSGNASPVLFFAKSFPGTDIYSPDDFPTVDIIILTHDHYDHLDYKTIKSLGNTVRQFYVPLGVSAHLEYWGIDRRRVNELDWWQTALTVEGFKLISAPARHFSGRGIKRNQTLWTSYILKMDEYTLFIGGDSGYDTHFKQIGELYGPFDIVFLESGQYNELWPYIHLRPEETVKAAIELNAKLLLPVHWGKFDLAFHAWDEPVRRVLKAARGKLNVTTPIIGEPVILGEQFPDSEWWLTQ